MISGGEIITSPYYVQPSTTVVRSSTPIVTQGSVVSPYASSYVVPSARRYVTDYDYSPAYSNLDRSVLLRRVDSEAFRVREESLHPSLKKIKETDVDEYIDIQDERIRELKREKAALKKQLAVAKNNQRSFGTRSEDYEINRLKRENRILKSHLGESSTVYDLYDGRAIHTHRTPRRINELKRANKRKYKHVLPKVYGDASPKVTYIQDSAPVTYVSDPAPVTYVRSTSPIVTTYAQPSYQNVVYSSPVEYSQVLV